MPSKNMGRVNTVTPSTMDAMPRPLRSTVLASLLVTLACANTPEPGGDSTTATSQAGSSGTAQPDAGGPTPSGAERGDPNSQIAAYVPVASTPATRPCEQMCGRVGDCLREGGDASDAGHLREVVHLELKCLDLCVNVEPSHDAGKRFRGCERHATCGPLLECTRNDWDAAAKARGTVTTQIDASPSYGVCELVCGGMYACVHHNRPLRQLTERSVDFERDVASCMMSCHPNEDSMLAFVPCADEETCDKQWECWQHAQTY
jgi:hypothetical protein